LEAYEDRRDYASKRAFPVAAQNDASSQLAIGRMHIGEGVPPDIDEGLKWFRLTAENPAASPTIRDEAIYSRDLISRRTKERADAEAAKAAAAAAAGAQLELSRAAAAAVVQRSRRRLRAK
jgi:TPR repeat protein